MPGNHGRPPLSTLPMTPPILLLLLACAAEAPTPAQGALDTPVRPPPAQPEPPREPALQALSSGRFHELEPGLALGRFVSPTPSTVGDGLITALKVDPTRFSVEVLSASREHPGQGLTGQAWSARHELLAVINAGMFAMDHSTATFALIDQGQENNPTLAPKAGSALLLEPNDPGLPSARLLDLRCDDLAGQRALYTSLVQSYRLLDCDGQPAWSPSHKIWSHALVGMDHSGNILFIHARSPWSTRDFTEFLLSLPLDIARLHYAEGGPEATLYLSYGERDLLLVGSYETGFNENDGNHQAWRVPNVIGVRRRLAH